jgi:hypothetical protein
VKKLFYLLFAVFILANAVAAYHAYRFTHFSKAEPRKTHNPEAIGFWEKARVLITGINNPRPVNTAVPSIPYKQVGLVGTHGKLSCWLIPKHNAKGTVILLHGYGSDKSKLLNEAQGFYKLGYQAFLLDFIGSGSSDGNNTTIGYREAEDVVTAFNYCRALDSNVILYGCSMGASAAIRAMSVYHIHPAAAILECPYGSMLYATKNRFALMGVPSFPMAYLLVFWGGAENSFWAYADNNIAYAKDIHTPVLLMRGQEDLYVTAEETAAVYNTLAGPKIFHAFAHTGHQSYYLKNGEEWLGQVKSFLSLYDHLL